MKQAFRAIHIHIAGLVQGVGFRPFVYRQAIKNNISGWVENNNEGVYIHAEGISAQLDTFLSDLTAYAPPASSIEAITTNPVEPAFFNNFSIQKSSNLSDVITAVSPDIAVCSACLADMQTQAHRLAYPFINCTNCGPRFSIIKALPYDRHLTTMQPFAICKTCEQEYTDMLDRRFHAQPVACLHCGPSYQILPDGAQTNKGDELANRIALEIDKGHIVALKGMGGYHLLCDALDNDAVLRLRLKKNREGKPLAVMVANTDVASTYFHLSPAEKICLASWQRPIVLLKNKATLTHAISKGLNTTGVVLPYMPLHFQLFKALKTQAIVLTSGNLSDEPVIISDQEALASFDGLADLVVGYNREIHNRADDSVVMVAGIKQRLIRRSRGFAPSPVPLQLNAEGIFAAGAELSNTFALGKGQQAILSQHIGDLKNAETLHFYEESYQRFAALFRFKPQLVVCDSHPDYLSAQFARNMGIQFLEVQHHHAHIASCMAEHGLNEKVIGIALDGTGYGTDGTIWGGEFFVCNLNGFERKYHFDPLPLPGGDQVTKQPWRTALSYLYKYFGRGLFKMDVAFLKHIDINQAEFIIQMMDTGINSPLSSGAGRLFDGVSALIGLCRETDYHAEAPMRLEAAIKPGCKGKYLFDLQEGKVVFYKTFYQIIKDVKAQTPVDEMSAKFHNTIVTILIKVVRLLNKETGLKKIVLSGGTFQNRYLLETTEKLLSDLGFEVYTQSTVPSNDGGIALGQLAIAAHLRESGKKYNE
jgi:hydrogenase maturation protein HypF